MSIDERVHRIAIVGTGVIGASWSAFYLAHGFDVVASDPAPNAETHLRRYVDDAWPLLTNVGLSEGGSRDQIEFTSLPQGFTTTVLQPMGANLAEWLPLGTLAAALPSVA